MFERRFERNVALFGAEGQRRLKALNIAVVGVGGLGTHVIQQLALLGVGGLVLIDGEEADDSNRNRYVGLLASDPAPGLRKVDLGGRLAVGVDPSIRVTRIFDKFMVPAGFAALRQADYIFGCLDNDGSRLILNEFCAAYCRPYIDLASDVVPGPPLQYGGRVCVNVEGGGCLVCLGEIDAQFAGRDLAGEAAARDQEAIYGVDQRFLTAAGPAVVSLNGVVASLGVTEFMVAVTGLRQPQKLLKYYGASGKVTARAEMPSPHCWYCHDLRGQGDRADLHRFAQSTSESSVA